MRSRATWSAVTAVLAVLTTSACGSQVVDSGVSGESRFSCRKHADCEDHPQTPVCSPSRGICVTRAELMAELGTRVDGDVPSGRLDAGSPASDAFRGTACVPAEARSCACPSGPSGTRTCNFMGSGFGPCECGPCIENQTEPCTCADGLLGYTTCQAGTFGPCECSGPSTSDASTKEPDCGCTSDDAGVFKRIAFADAECVCGDTATARVGQFVPCATSLDEALQATCWTLNREVVVGCGMRAVWCYDPVGPSWSLAFDEETGERVGVTLTNDVQSGSCSAFGYYWGKQQLAPEIRTCPDFATCVRDSGPDSVDGWLCPTTDAGRGIPATPEATGCFDADDDTTCTTPGALCDSYLGETKPCSEAGTPFCDCASGDCICWDLYAGVEPPYQADATPCAGTEDTTSCAAPDAYCMSSRPDIAERCTEFDDVACDCDDACICWGDPYSRK